MSVYVVALIGNPEFVEEKIKELWPTESVEWYKEAQT